MELHGILLPAQVFTNGCNLRCPFCHNATLVLRPGTDEISEEEVFAFLEKRRGTLDGVAVTGGEPLLQPWMPEFLRRVRAMGYAVKLDTNGCFPDRLRGVLEEGLADMVAMDVKNSPERYGITVGRENFDLNPVMAAAFCGASRTPALCSPRASGPARSPSWPACSPPSVPTSPQPPSAADPPRAEKAHRNASESSFQRRFLFRPFSPKQLYVVFHRKIFMVYLVFCS